MECFSSEKTQDLFLMQVINLGKENRMTESGQLSKMSFHIMEKKLLKHWYNKEVDFQYIIIYGECRDFIFLAKNRFLCKYLLRSFYLSQGDGYRFTLRGCWRLSCVNENASHNYPWDTLLEQSDKSIVLLLQTALFLPQDPVSVVCGPQL